MAKIDELLHLMVKRSASDLHLTSTFKPFLRIHGEMETIDEHPVMTPDFVQDLVTEIMPEKNKPEFEERWDTDFAYAIPELGRFRVNVFKDRYGMGSVMRTIPSKVPTADDLKLPKAIRDLCYLTKGFVVVTGPTGSGKSTTLAAIIDLINKTRSDHIITIEDPLEFVHEPQKCLINQREVHTHTRSFANALRAALREDPDIVLVGEMRDLETIEIAIETAETGHLVFATLHTNTAPSTVDRLIDKFPANRQNQIRTMLADSLKGVVAQVLCKKIGGGRVAAHEILITTPAISSMIRDNKTFQIPSAMQIGKAYGMQQFNDVLMQLVTSGQVAPREAYLKSIDKETMAKMLQSAGFKLDMSAEPPPTSGAPGDDMTAKLVQQNMEQLKKNPSDPEALVNVAWIMSTNNNAKYRNGQDAVMYAEKAVQLTQSKDINALDTLGAAYAEMGSFDKAIEHTQKALDLASKSGQKEFASIIKDQIKLYEAKKPFRDG